MKKSIVFFLIILSLFQISLSKKIEYKPYSSSNIYELIPSSTRFVESLTGKWQISYDKKEWSSVKIPYAIEEEKVFYIRRTVKIPQRLLNKYTWHLYFLGFDDELELYINDQFVGNYFGGLSPLSVKINSRMFRGETNTILMKIIPAEFGSRQIKEQHIYAKEIRTGLSREVFLVGTPDVWIKDFKYRLNFNSNLTKCKVINNVSISTVELEKIFKTLPDSLNFNKSKFSVKVETIIKNRKSKEIVAQSSAKEIMVQPERTNSVKFNLTVLNPKLWSVDSPELYQLTVRISKGSKVIDEINSDIGFRSLSIQTLNNRKVFVLNRELLEIKGVDYIEDYYHTNSSLDVNRMKRDIINIKMLGANVVRFKYTLPDPYFVKLCNQYGLMVFLELPVYDVPLDLVNSDEIKVRMKNIAERMVDNYSNDPSVVAWGIYEGLNEDLDRLKEFEDYIVPYFKKRSKNLLFKTTNLFSDNIKTKNYDFVLLRQIGTKKSIDKINTQVRNWNKKINKPIIFNFGLAIQPNNHNGYSDPMSVESQANYLYNLYYIAKNDTLSGVMIWSYNDYKLHNPLLILNNYFQYVCTSGLIDRYRQQRMSYKTMQALFNNEKDPIFYAGSYSVPTPVVFIIYGFIISIILFFLINRFKRFREYLFRSLMRPYNFYADIRDQRIMSTLQTYILGFIISYTLAIFFSSFLYIYRTEEITQYILMLIFPLPAFQELLYKVIWMPELFILIVGMLLFIKIFVIAFIIKIVSLFVRARIFFSDTYTIVIWAGTPILFLLPFAIILNKILILIPVLVLIMLALTILILIWVYFRILRVISVVFDVRSAKSYLFGVGFILATGLVAISIYQFKFSVLSYSEYLLNVLL